VAGEMSYISTTYSTRIMSLDRSTRYCNMKGANRAVQIIWKDLVFETTGQLDLSRSNCEVGRAASIKKLLPFTNVFGGTKRAVEEMRMEMIERDDGRI
jgi:hypothetical protein